MSSSPIFLPRRRTLIALATSALAMGCSRAGNDGASGAEPSALSVLTFGDSILDCGRYNRHSVNPGKLLVRNDDHLFPEFQGQDLQSLRGGRLIHRAVDGATVDRLEVQADGVAASGDGVALVTIGGNDLLRGLAVDQGSGLRAFARTLRQFCERLPVRPILLGTVYDPTFGDNARNFLGVEPRLARTNLRRVNEIIAEIALRYGAVADLHAHFLTGASEVRRVFWSVLQARGLASPGRKTS